MPTTRMGTIQRELFAVPKDLPTLFPGSIIMNYSRGDSCLFLKGPTSNSIVVPSQRNVGVTRLGCSSTRQRPFVSRHIHTYLVGCFYFKMDDMSKGVTEGEGQCWRWGWGEGELQGWGWGQSYVRGHEVGVEVYIGIPTRAPGGVPSLQDEAPQPRERLRDPPLHRECPPHRKPPVRLPGAGNEETHWYSASFIRTKQSSTRRVFPNPLLNLERGP